MNTNAKKFHESRRAFIIMHDAGLLVAPTNTDISHQDLLLNMGIPLVPDVLRHLTDPPRGYHMNGELCLYQGYLNDEQTWNLQPQNYKLVQQYIPDLKALFNLTDDSKIYLGVRVGRVGEVWEKINKTTIRNFMRTR